MKNFLKKTLVGTLAFLAKAAIRRHEPRIIAITGSVGKTSTKDAIYAVVSSAFEARASEKSHNSEIGLPLSILGLENAWGSALGWIRNIFKSVKIAFFSSYFPEWLVLEIGADHPGDIEKVSKWLRPEIVVLTRMSEVPVHVEFFADAREVLREKMFLAKALKQGGTLVINADDRDFMEACRSLHANRVTYGAAKDADVRITETEAIYGQAPLSLPRGQYAILDVRGEKERIELDGVVGRHLVYPLAAAAAVASILNIADDLPLVFSCLEMPKGRMRTLPGKSKSIIIDDTYNSSPVACVEALRTLNELSVKGKKIAALGDMKELGSHGEQAHLEIGKLAGETVHTLVTVGEMGRDFARGALSAGISADRILSFNTSAEAATAIADIARAGDAILVKGSQSMRMERVVCELLEDRSKAAEFLVRQEEEWKRR